MYFVFAQILQTNKTSCCYQMLAHNLGSMQPWPSLIHGESLLALCQSD